jgi:hypothetical protein
MPLLDYDFAMHPKAHDHHHVHACDCAAHRAHDRAGRAPGIWSALFPVLACAICPACIATYAKVLSVLGVSFGLTEFQHVVLLTIAIAVSLAVSVWRSIRTRRLWPVAFATIGAALVLIGHLLGELHVLEWTGVLVLLISGLTEHVRLRNVVATPAVRASA